MRRSYRPTPGAPLFRVAVCLLLASGCKVTEEDVDYWTGTIKGPGKIVAVLLADKYEDDLRVYSGLALVRMEPREDVDGVSELQAAVRRLDEGTRARLVDQMVPSLIEMMNGEDVEAAEGEGVPLRQIRAKDAAFLLIPYASEEQRQALTEAVVGWFTVDFNERSLSGNFSAEQVIRQLGAPAAARLVNALNARLPQQALVKIAELIATLGDAPAKDRAAERLVAIEQEMESDEFMDWLRQGLRDQLQAQGREVEENRVELAAALNRENFITLGALPAMKHLNEQAAIQDRLLQIAQSSEVERLGAEAVNTRRTKALQAMEGGVRREQVDALLDIALNAENDIQIRDYAFDRVADSRAESAVPRLWPTFDETEDWRVRWRVGSLILTLGGNDVVQPFLNRLDDEEYAREELYGYGERLSQMRPAPNERMTAELRADEWYRRAIALYFWERRAERDDIARVRALSGDRAETQGPHWEEQDTVGKVATAVADAIEERLNRGAGEAGESEPGEPESGESGE
jgi:hypothetical protein